jgi:hypothetical protein
VPLAQEGDIALLAAIDRLAAANGGHPVVIHQSPGRIEVPARRVGPVVTNQIWIAFNRCAHLMNRPADGAAIPAENIRIARPGGEVWNPGDIGIREERHAIAKFVRMMIACGIEIPIGADSQQFVRSAGYAVRKPRHGIRAPRRCDLLPKK